MNDRNKLKIKEAIQFSVFYGDETTDRLTIAEARTLINRIHLRVMYVLDELDREDDDATGH